MTSPAPHPDQQPSAPRPAPPGWQQQQPSTAWSSQQRFAPPQQFRVVADHELASQRSHRIATKALVFAIVGLVSTSIPLLGFATGLGLGIAGLQQGIVSRLQRLGGKGKSIAAIVIGSLAIVSSFVWPWVNLFLLFAIFTG